MGEREGGTRAGRVPELPSEVSQRVGPFDRFAGLAARFSSRALFFTFCVVLILLWAPSLFLFKDVDTWQLIINTATTIITFLLVALLQNSQTRSDQAIQHKLNAIAQGIGDLMDHLDAGSEGQRDLSRDRAELRAAVGLELIESSDHNAKDDSSSGVN